MDPHATLFDLLDAVQRNDREAIDEILEALRHWNDRGGFMPILLELHTPAGKRILGITRN